MPSGTGIAGALLGAFGRYSENTLTRITKARVDIKDGNYDSKMLMKDVLDWSDDLVDLWTLPLSISGGAAPAAVIQVASDQNTADLLTALPVDAPEVGAPVPTVLRQLEGNAQITPPNQIELGWEDGKRGLLTINLKNLDGSNGNLEEGYYLGAAFIDQTLLATIHVNVVAP